MASTGSAACALALAGLMLVPASAPAPGVVERKQAVDRRLYSAEARLRAAIDRQAVLTSDLATINRRLREVRGRLAPLAARRDEAVRAHRLARGTLVQVNRDLAFQRRQLRIATSRLRVQRQALAERIREIYRTEDDDPLLGLLQGGSLAEIAGAASGIGRATALRFAREGAAVAVVDLEEVGGQAVVGAIVDEGGRALFLRCDVSQAADCQRAVQETLDKLGGLDILFNNAGRFAFGNPFPDPAALGQYFGGIEESLARVGVQGGGRVIIEV